MKRETGLDLVVAAVTTAGIVLYRLFHDQLAGKLLFIVPVLAVVTGLFVLRGHTSSRPGRTLGLDMTALRASSLVTLTVTAPAVVGLLAWAWTRGTWPESVRNLVVAVVIYPVWGTGQQAIFQGLLHGSLDRLGLGAWAIPVVATGFAFVHPASDVMLAVTLAAGLVWSAIFHRYRNLLPIGVAHGLLGALFYYLVLEKDVIAGLL